MKHPKSRFFILLAAIPLLATAGLPADVGPAYAVRNCRIVPVAGPLVEKGTIIIRDGLIESLGPADKVPIPSDAQVIEADGLIAYPGLISAHSNLFLETARPSGQGFPGMMRPTQPAQGEDKYPPSARLRVLDQIEVKRPALESYHKAGLTTALVAPARGIFEGQSVLLNLNGEALLPMVLRNAVALHINFTTERGSYPSSLMGTIALIRQRFLDAGYCADRQAQYEKILLGMKRPDYDPEIEALVPFVREGKPVVFQCNNVEDVKRALKIIDEFKLNALIAGANEAWRAAGVLKKRPLPLLVTLDFKPPSGSRYVNQGEELKKQAETEIYPANPAALAREGLRFALTTLGLADGPAFTKNAAAAVKAGLPREEALRALTIEPARFLGFERQLGTLEPGKIANVILTRGELFDEKTRVNKVFVDGILFDYEEKSR
jgi:imidazolonepropionase-like amidohydrolase